MSIVPDLIQHPFLRNALAAGVLASVACGVVGSFVVARRITYVAGGIAHCVLGGLGAARYCQVRLGWDWFDPLLGALLSALLAAGIIGFAALRLRQREDTVIGAVWAVGMAVGLMFIQATPGYSTDLMGYLFGDILLVAPRDLWLIAAVDILVIVVTILMFHRFVAISFDEEFARLRGVATQQQYLLLLALVAITVVVLMKVVGIVLVVALLTLPVAIAGTIARSLGAMIVYAVLLTMIFTSGGLVLSYEPDWPAGATIILLCGVAYLLSVARKSFRAARD
ncbi:MAG: metal ABC transporter permease [Planctomycetota bacterium]|nr:MAG: metal ABC transporter permease [Planctomycetota bacterium]